MRHFPSGHVPEKISKLPDRFYGSIIVNCSIRLLDNFFRVGNWVTKALILCKVNSLVFNECRLAELLIQSEWKKSRNSFLRNNNPDRFLLIQNSQIKLWPEI